MKGIKLFMLTACLAGAGCLAAVPAGATAPTEGSGGPKGGSSESRVELFAGVDFNVRDLFFDKPYELLINLTPGVKWHLGHRWQLAGQALVPVYNDYGDRYKKIRLNMAVLSKEWDWQSRLFLKVSGGLFGQERYGFDAKAFWAANRWLAFDAQVGLTGFCSMAADWECSKMQRVTALAGTRVYLERVNTEFRLQGGRYLYEDYAVKGEAMRHFRHCTLGLYAQYSDVWKENGGFKVVMMIPPYQRRKRKLSVRPASNFRWVYNFQGQAYAAKMYQTDPEENEREGNFDRSRLDWGVNRMTRDFEWKGGDR